MVMRRSCSQKAVFLLSMLMDINHFFNRPTPASSKRNAAVDFEDGYEIGHAAINQRQRRDLEA